MTTAYPKDIPELAWQAICDVDVQVEEAQFENPVNFLIE